MASKHNPYPTYFVIGTGRCGTSTVARILHEDFNIHMGDEFYPTDRNNPRGYYEDRHIHTINNLMAKGSMPFNKWVVEIQERVNKWRKLDQPWGLKLAAHSGLLPLYLVWTPRSRVRIIRCIRQIDLVIDSFMRSYEGWAEKGRIRTKKMVVNKLKMVNRQIKGKDHLLIYFNSEHKSDYDIAIQIHDKWPDIVEGI